MQEKSPKKSRKDPSGVSGSSGAVAPGSGSGETHKESHREGSSGPRSPRLTKEVAQRIEVELRRGNFRRHAAAVAGVDERTLKNWMRWGQLENAKEPYRSFAVAVVAAENQAITRNVRAINQAAGKDWKAAAWYLSRKAREEWGEQARQSVKEQLEFLLQVIVDVLGPDSASIVLEEVARRAGRQEAEGSPGAPPGTLLS